ncbi:hypothetical protein [Paenibacillus sp. 4624]|uniref:hypothetical protein n=1 Tax=Paenibacillus sp. 4624 TaxID=3156453 RepID=UPI003D234652
MDYKKFKVHLKDMADRGFSIQESIAFRKPFLPLDMYGCSELIQTPLNTAMISRLHRSFGTNITLMELTQHNWNELFKDAKLGPITSENMYTFFYEMSEQIPFEFNDRDYYSSYELARIMNVPDDEMILQLQAGRYKGAFIDQSGQWRKKKPNSSGKFS